MGSVVTAYYEYGQEELDALRQRDATFGNAIERLGKLEREVIPDLFAALVHAVVGQLISLQAARTVWGRMQRELGEISARQLARVSVDEIRACGLTMKKAQCIHSLASRIDAGTWDIEALRQLTDDEVVLELTKQDGIGRWTAEMLLIHGLARRDVLSYGDAAIRKGIMRLYGLTELSKLEFEQVRARFSPYGTIASIYLWALAHE